MVDNSDYKTQRELILKSMFSRLGLNGTGKSTNSGD